MGPSCRAAKQGKKTPGLPKLTRYAAEADERHEGGASGAHATAAHHHQLCPLLLHKRHHRLRHTWGTCCVRTVRRPGTLPTGRHSFRDTSPQLATVQQNTAGHTATAPSPSPLTHAPEAPPAAGSTCLWMSTDRFTSSGRLCTSCGQETGGPGGGKLRLLHTACITVSHDQTALRTSISSLQPGLTS